MKRINNLLYIPALLPIAFVILLSILNFDKRTHVQFLIWKSSDVSIGYLLLLSSSSSFLIGSIPYFLLNQNTLPNSRKVKIDPNELTPSNNDPQAEDYKFDQFTDSDIYLERDIRDPSPTVSVPFRIIQNKQNTPASMNNRPRKPSTSRKYSDQLQRDITSSNFVTTTDNSDWSDNLDEHW